MRQTFVDSSSYDITAKTEAPEEISSLRNLFSSRAYATVHRGAQHRSSTDQKHELKAPEPKLRPIRFTGAALLYEWRRNIVRQAER
jgi:hypothetical protein